MYHLDPGTQTAFAREHAERLRLTMLAGKPVRADPSQINVGRRQPAHIDVSGLLQRLTPTRGNAL